MELVCCESAITRRATRDPVLCDDKRVLQNLLTTEDKYVPPSSYFSCVQTDIQPYMRKMVSHWMLEVCEEQTCEEEVFLLAMNYLDRFLCVQNINRNRLQLLGAACMLAASKLKDNQAMTIPKLVTYTDDSITPTELMEMESMLLQYLKWDLCATTPLDFLTQILHHLELPPKSVEMIKCHCQTFFALCATDCKFMLYPASMMAAGCVGAAAKGLSLMDENRMLQFLQRLTGIELECLRSCQEAIEGKVRTDLQSLSPSDSDSQKGDDSLQEQPTTPTEVEEVTI